MSTDQLESLRTAWRASARYSVYRTQIGFQKVALSSGLTYDEAKQAVSAAEASIRSEPRYRPNVMGRPMALMQLENPDFAQQRFHSLLESGTQKC